MEDITINIDNIYKNNNNNYSEVYQSSSNGSSNNTTLDSLNLKPQIKPDIGPNVNIKLPKNLNRSEEQKEFFKRKINKTKKTELCKNWEIFNDCYYKDKCSFAHGENELRNKTFFKNEKNNKYKTKPCRTFLEKTYCPFGNRCQYTHVVSRSRLLSYKAINLKMANGILIEAMKTENEQFDFLKLLDNTNMNKLVKM